MRQRGKPVAHLHHPHPGMCVLGTNTSLPPSTPPPSIIPGVGTSTVRPLLTAVVCLRSGVLVSEDCYHSVAQVCIHIDVNIAGEGPLSSPAG